MTFLKDSFKLRSSQTETDEERKKKEVRETKVLVYGAGVLLTLASLFSFYITFSEGIMSDDFFSSSILSIVLGALAFLCFSPWKRTNYLIGGILVSSVGIWLFVSLLDYQNEDSFIALVWMTIGIGLWGSALLARALNRTLFGIIKDFFQLQAVKTTGGIIRKLLKFALWLGLIVFVIWLIIALGPLWIIAIILLLMLFVVANR